jgi:limonene-1,2-epoxide hydrolase
MPRWTCLLAGLALLLSACGSGNKDAKTPPPAKQSPTATPPAVPKRKPAAQADIAVIRGWTDALRHGRVDAATDYFSLPAVISNGGPAYRLTKRKQVRVFNRTLPCGAKFKEAIDTGAYVIATLVLTERPGRGKCGSGAVGNEAYTAFLIRRHKIVQWRRVVKPGPETTPTPEPGSES